MASGSLQEAGGRWWWQVAGARVGRCCRWRGRCTRGDLPEVMHQRRCIRGDAPDAPGEMHQGRCTRGDAPEVMHQMGCTRGDAPLEMRQGR